MPSERKKEGVSAFIRAGKEFLSPEFFALGERRRVAAKDVLLPLSIVISIIEKRHPECPEWASEDEMGKCLSELEEDGIIEALEGGIYKLIKEVPIISTESAAAKRMRRLRMKEKNLESSPERNNVTDESVTMLRGNEEKRNNVTRKIVQENTGMDEVGSSFPSSSSSSLNNPSITNNIPISSHASRTEETSYVLSGRKRKRESVFDNTSSPKKKKSEALDEPLFKPEDIHSPLCIPAGEKNEGIEDCRDEKDDSMRGVADGFLPGFSPIPAEYKVESGHDARWFMERYNELCPKMPHAISMSAERRKHLAARISEYGEEGVLEMLRLAGESPFLSGENSRGWKADLTWLLLPSNFEKVIEGRYTRSGEETGQKRIKSVDEIMTEVRDGKVEVEESTPIEKAQIMFYNLCKLRGAPLPSFSKDLIAKGLVNE